MLELKDRSACSTTRCSAPRPTARQSSSPARRRPPASWRGPRWCCCGRRGPIRRCCRSRRGRDVRLCVLGPLARPGPGGLARRLFEPRQPPPRAGGHAARRHPRALARGGLRPRLRLRPRRRRGRDRRGGGARRAGATHVVLFLGEPHEWSGEFGGAGRPAAARRPAPAGRGGAPGEPGGEARRLRHRRAGAAHPARGRGGGRRALLDGARSAPSPARRSPTSSPGSPTPSGRLSHGLPFADGITSGFDTRRRGPTGRRCRWCRARPRGGSATTGAPTTSASAPAGRRPTPSARAIPTRPSPSRTGRSTRGGCRPRAATPLTASVAGDQHRQPRRHRDGAPLLSGHGLRGAGAAAARPARPPAGDARARRVGDARLHRHAGDAREVRPRLPRPAGGSGPTATRRRTPTGSSSSSTRARRSTRSSASATRLACSFTLVP